MMVLGRPKFEKILLEGALCVSDLLGKSGLPYRTQVLKNPRGGYDCVQDTIEARKNLVSRVLRQKLPVDLSVVSAMLPEVGLKLSQANQAPLMCELKEVYTARKCLGGSWRDYELSLASQLKDTPTKSGLMLELMRRLSCVYYGTIPQEIGIVWFLGCARAIELGEITAAQGLGLKWSAFPSKVLKSFWSGEISEGDYDANKMLFDSEAIPATIKSLGVESCLDSALIGNTAKAVSDRVLVLGADVALPAPIRPISAPPAAVTAGITAGITAASAAPATAATVPQEKKKKFLPILKRLLKESGLTQEELGEKVGISGSSVCLLLSGRTLNPSLSTAAKFARAFKNTGEMLGVLVQTNGGEARPLTAADLEMAEHPTAGAVTISARLREFMFRQKMRVAGVAHATGISDSGVRSVLNGVGTPCVGTVVKMLSGLSMPLNYFDGCPVYDTVGKPHKKIIFSGSACATTASDVTPPSPKNTKSPKDPASEVLGDVNLDEALDELLRPTPPTAPTAPAQDDAKLAAAKDLNKILFKDPEIKPSGQTNGYYRPVQFQLRDNTYKDLMGTLVMAEEALIQAKRIKEANEVVVMRKRLRELLRTE